MSGTDQDLSGGHSGEGDFGPNVRVADDPPDGNFIEARIGPMVMSLLVGSRPRRIHMLDWPSGL